MANQTLLFMLVMILVVGCGRVVQDKLLESKVTGFIQSAFFVNNVEPVAGRPGTAITLHGYGLSGGLNIKIDGQEVTGIVGNDQELKFKLPSLEPGLKKLTISKLESQAEFHLFLLSEDSKPLILGDSSAAVCSGQAFFDLSGQKLEGSKNCEATEDTIEPCSSDGQVDCLASQAFPAVDASTLAPKVLSGQAVAGVEGTFAPDYPGVENVRAGDTVNGVPGQLADCSSDGATGCVANESYKAADISFVIPPNIRSSVTVAGVAGSYTGSNPDCSEDGEVGCITTSGFRAADMNEALPANIRSGKQIAGVTGSYPSLVTPLAGSTATADLQSLSASTPAGTYEFFDSTGSHYSGTIYNAGTIVPNTGDQSFNSGLYRQFTVKGDPDLAEGKIMQGVGIFNVVGTLDGENHGDCTGDGAIGCVATTLFPAADASLAVPANIRTGVNIAGQTGAYPSGAHRLNNADSNVTDLTALDSATLPGVYEFYDSAGNRYTGTVVDPGNIMPSTTDQVFNGVFSNFMVHGDSDLLPANIRKDVQLFNKTGIYPSGSAPLATADATPDLDFNLFNAKIKSAANFEWFDSHGNRYTNVGDADISAENIRLGISIFGITGTYNGVSPDAWTVRVGTTINGIVGKLKPDCRNARKASVYNSTSDPYDTLDDYYSPSEMPFGSEFFCDPAEIWQDLTNDGSCNNSLGESCMFKDRITRTYWSSVRAAAEFSGANGAMSGCENLDYLGFTDWRLPTQKELMTAYQHGIISLCTSTLILDSGFGCNDLESSIWTATTVSNDTSRAYYFNLKTGSSGYVPKTEYPRSYLCVRP